MELFTSQGCNLCPPADDILTEFSKQENILALSYSVDYWNYLGWEDTLARPECTLRQKKYNITLGKNGIYTPQMIIQGDHDVIGSRQDLIDKMVEDVRQTTRDYQPTGLDITFDLTGGMIDLRISGNENETSATIWIVGYDFEKTVNIKRGELSGQVRKYHNVVQAIKRIGRWTGEDVKLTLSRKDIGDVNYDAYALLLQAHETGPIIAAAKLRK
ncbi:MAG: DUF1223 domain-containing protein [Emcibacter sp.]|nr:DUF1223 domain-containing protein [Emcibacter sp.]